MWFCVVAFETMEATMRLRHKLHPEIVSTLTLDVSPLRHTYEDFLLSRKAMLCTKATYSFYTFTTGKFVTWLEWHQVTESQSITAAHVREWLAEAVSRGLKDTSLHAMARAARTFLRFLHAEGYIPQPIKITMPRLEKKRLPFLEKDELQMVLKACDLPRDKAMLIFLADSGLRRDELVALNWGDIDMETGAVRVLKGKGNKYRTAAIGAFTRRLLLKYRRTLPEAPRLETPLFLTDEGGRLSGEGIYRIIHRTGQRAGVKVSPHALRRTFARLSLLQGIDIINLQKLMGHSDISMTSHYIQSLDEDLLAAHQAHGLDGWL
jgi:integrase/recombinase XerD